MLQAAVIYEPTFNLFREIGYANDFLHPPPARDVPAVPKVWPTAANWEIACAFIPFLETFYEATLRFSGSTYVTASWFTDEVVIIRAQLQEWVESDDVLLSNMADFMVLKYEAYWEVSKINMMLYIAVLLDPRRKEAYLSFCLKE